MQKKLLGIMMGVLFFTSCSFIFDRKKRPIFPHRMTVFVFPFITSRHIRWSFIKTSIRSRTMIQQNLS